MKPILREMTYEDALYVIHRMRPSDVAGLQAASPGMSCEEYAKNRMGADIKYTMLAPDGEPVGIGGCSFIYVKTAVLWMIATPRIGAVKKSVVSFSRLFMREMLASGLVARLQAHVIEGQPRCKEFAEFLGLQLEGRHPKTCANGETLLTYGKVL